MNRHTRRALVLLVPGIPLAVLAGCAALSQPVKVDLTTAKQWVNLGASALVQFASDVLAGVKTLTPAQTSAIGQWVATIEGSNNLFQNLSLGAANAAQVATQVLEAIRALKGVLAPLWPAVAAAGPQFDVVITVVEAFVSGLSILIPPMPATLVKEQTRYNLAHKT